MCRHCCHGPGESCCPKCYSNWRARSNYKGHVKYREPRKEIPPMAKRPIKKADPPSAPEPVMRPEARSEFEQRFPNLYSWMFDTTYDDGTPRITSTVTFFVERGALKLVINDRDTNKSAFKAASSLLEGLELLEEGLDTDSLDWRLKRG